MMRIAYLPVNDAWVVLFGDAIISIGSACQTLFASRAILESTLEHLGLRVDGNRVVCVD
ncbi:hypothetical protein J2T57_001513 [Natronocella acetinitrilica]|uniref:Uncharacterized protein n=1 Tax=Natronocella acetinitrilica TaxID=414046 RepID=A0AAE3G450_9GAMM|nr:hypothetical protein [Natronocella acetinitrilica]MCP1674411.1 hypothetical protein [Natronocella acetinitrilica]